ncbi:hypothetical protein FQN57_005701 [Myotisia sp. PD_48]|nr:hypothetical protein FQN57_005701 [Myotisia sp. PD_48]
MTLTWISSHYKILNLPHPPSPLRKQDIKAAYHRALLTFHPDKTSAGGDLSPSIHTVDQITTAYRVLSDPSAKREYDKLLVLSGFQTSQHPATNRDQGDLVFRTGLEIFDLDDMQMGTNTSEDQNDEDIWFRGCRCGDEKGFLVTEQDLEKEAEKGELVIGCRGCSLWAKVVFAIQEDVPG